MLIPWHISSELLEKEKRISRMIRIALCDDEKEMRLELSEQIHMYLLERGIKYQLSLFESGEELLESTDSFDLYFLDIQMKRLSGMETARQLRADKKGGYIVFITVLEDYVYDAFEVEAADYLVKPVRENRFLRMMERICVKLSAQKQRNLLISSKGNHCVSIPFDDIYYCEIVNHRLYVHTKHTVIDCRMKMEQAEQMVDHRFLKCHRSYLVNLDYVRGYKDNAVWLENGETIPVSKLRLSEFSQKMLQYMKER